MSLPLCVRVDYEDEASAAHLSRDGWHEVEHLDFYSGNMTFVENKDVRSPYTYEIEEILRICDFGYSRLYKEQRIHDANFIIRGWVRDELMRPNVISLVVLEKGEIAGFVTMKDRRILHIATAFKFRNQGYGRRLLHSLGTGILVAATQSDNTNATKLYKSVGMTHTRTQRTFHKWP